MKLIIDRIDLTAGFSSPFLFAFDDLAERLIQTGYKQPPGGEKTISFDDSGLSELRRLVGKGADIIYNEQKGHLFSTATDPKLLVEALESALRLVENILSRHPSTKWYELNYRARALPKKHPLEVSSVGKGNGLPSLDRITGLSSQPYGQTYCAFDGPLPEVPLNTITNWLHLTVQPFVPNPIYYYVNLVYRRESLDDVKRILDHVETVVEEAIERE